MGIIYNRTIRCHPDMDGFPFESGASQGFFLRDFFLMPPLPLALSFGIKWPHLVMLFSISQPALIWLAKPSCAMSMIIQMFGFLVTGTFEERYVTNLVCFNLQNLHCAISRLLSVYFRFPCNTYSTIFSRWGCTCARKAEECISVLARLLAGSET